MSDRNPNFHNRRSIRLKGYDYSQAGLYFITLCVQNRERLFGEIRLVGETLRGRPETDPVETDPVETDPVGANPVGANPVGANPVGAILRDRPENSDNISKGDHAGSPRQQQRQRMILNDAGKMVEIWYAEMENKYPNIRCHEMIVMPNHFHCIIEIMDTVGAPLRGHPDDIPVNDDPNSPYGPGNKKYHPVIGNVVGWFKTMTTNEYIRGV